MEDKQEENNVDEEDIEKCTPHQIQLKLMDYEMKRWQEERGKYVEFDIKTMNKYNKYYKEMATINVDKKEDKDEGIGIEQLEEPFISFGLAFSRDEINTLIASVDDDGSGRIEFPEFLRIIHNKSKLKTKGSENITKFFKQLANDELGDKHTDLKHFGFKTIMGIVRRQNLLNAFLSKNDEESAKGKKVLKAYTEMLQKRKMK